MEIRRFLHPETVLGLTLPVAVFLAWPEGTSYHALVFSLAWAWLMLPAWPTRGNARLSAWGGVVSPAMYRMAGLLAGPFFLLLCFSASINGNFLLWLKIVYYIGFSARFVYLLHYRPSGFVPVMWLCLWALCALFPLLWPPTQLDGYTLLYLLLLGLLWPLGCALLLFLVKAPVRGLLLMLLHLGPLLPLALAWPNIACWLLATLALLLALLRYSRSNTEKAAANSGERGVLWLPLWLFRSALLTWWCLGCALCVSLAWWLPVGHGLFFVYNAWIKSVCLGLFVLICLGLLLEYSMPLIGRPEPEGYWRRDQSWGPMFSALAVLLLLLPSLLLPENKEPDFYFENRARAVLFDDPARLDEHNPEISVLLPEDVLNVRHVYVVSRLADGLNVPQGQVVAVLALTGESGLPGVHYLRAGIDTAEQDLGQSRIMAMAQHQAVEYAAQTPAFSPDGQAYFRRSYISGFSIQELSGGVRGISLHYTPLHSFTEDSGPTPVLLVEKIMID